MLLTITQTKYINKTETIQNDLNPSWSKSVLMEYHFEQEQKLRIFVLDIDKNSSKLSDHDVIGQVEVSEINRF